MCTSFRIFRGIDQLSTSIRWRVWPFWAHAGLKGFKLISASPEPVSVDLDEVFLNLIVDTARVDLR